jgi:hypothetical protein
VYPATCLSFIALMAISGVAIRSGAQALTRLGRLLFFVHPYRQDDGSLPVATGPTVTYAGVPMASIYA